MLYHTLNQMAKSAYNEELRANGEANEARERERMYIKGQVRYLRQVSHRGGYCFKSGERLFLYRSADDSCPARVSESMFQACIEAGISERG